MSKLTRLLDLLAEPPYSRELILPLRAVAMLEVCPAKMTEVAEAARFSTAAATDCADALERNGLAVRKGHPVDRRQTILHRTPAGDTLLVKILTLLDAPEPDDRPANTQSEGEG